MIIRIILVQVLCIANNCIMIIDVLDLWGFGDIGHDRFHRDSFVLNTIALLFYCARQLQIDRFTSFYSQEMVVTYALALG